jgi:basic membrane protein A and related proteins
MEEPMLRSHRSFLVSLGVAAAAGIVAVGAGWGGNSKKAAGMHAQAVSSAFVLSVGKSPANPFGYANLLAYQAAAKMLGGSQKTVELLPTGQFESTFTNFARQGINVIFAGGSEFQQVLYRVAPKFPKTIFVCVTCVPSKGQPKNLVNVRHNHSQTTYLAGVAAGIATKSNKVGDISGFEYPDVAEAAYGFRAGVLAVNPKATVKIVYAGTWQDPSKVRAAAQAMLGQGFDVIRHETNAAGAGLFDAVRSTKAWAVGSYLDQRPLAPNNTLISSGANFGTAYTLVAKKVMANQLTKPTYLLDFSNGGIFMTPVNPKVSGAAAIQRKVNAYKQKIISGKLIVPDKILK